MAGWQELTTTLSYFMYVLPHSKDVPHICAIPANDFEQPPEDTRPSWFTMDQEYGSWFRYLKLGDRWVCIGEEGGHMYVNLKNKGYWALAHIGEGTPDKGRLSQRTEVHLGED
jgi:hypothetical protein